MLHQLLHRFDPERAHEVALVLLGLGGRLPGLMRAVFGEIPQRPVRAFGLEFANPLGLAAGFDKDARGYRGLSLLGFGHVELGTVTPRPQAGNPRPRIFRFPRDRALINRMGFPSEGMEYVAQRLAWGRPPGVVLGINLGKNKDTPLEEAARDYCAVMNRLAGSADYLVVNVSSPNTPGLRRLQERGFLSALLGEVVTARDALPQRRPLLVKLSPDLDEAGLDSAVEAIEGSGADGIIATNTTISREGLSVSTSESGGLSGAPLAARSLEVVRWIARRTDLPVVAAGGVDSAASAQRCLDAGAVLVQVFTGFVIRGPRLPGEIVRGLGTPSRA